MTYTLETLPFENTYGALPEYFYSRVQPQPFERPFLVSANPEAAALIDLHPAELRRPEFVDYFCGKRRLPGSDPISMVYAGHQFGHYVPQLGDGRALLLGEVRNRQGMLWDLQLKGSGRTPYSRFGDGRAVLRSTIREYLCSEAMAGLGIPTTRALCIVGSDEPVQRETLERGAMLARLSPSHVRFGSFEFFYYTRQETAIRELADYVVDRHFPEWADDKERYRRFFEQAVHGTARLMARWQAVGFMHGVMNTDNMSILGLTIDYGPYGFMEAYDPEHICNHSDNYGRYAYRQQPGIGHWNLNALATALMPLVSNDDLSRIIDTYVPVFSETYRGLMLAKLGIEQTEEEDMTLVLELLDRMHHHGADYPTVFRLLSEEELDGAFPRLRMLFREDSQFDAWWIRWRERMAMEGRPERERSIRMKAVNPKYILRNYLAEQAIRRAEDAQDYSEIDRLLALLRRPFDEQPDMEDYAGPPPPWAQSIVVSCSS